MKSVRKVRGITLMGFIIVMAVVGFFAYIGMKIGPAYLEYYTVLQTMKGVAAEPSAINWSPNDIWNAMDKRMYINYVNEAHVGKKNFEIKRKGASMTIRVKYEVRDQLFGNLDYVASFDKTVAVGSGRLAE